MIERLDEFLRDDVDEAELRRVLEATVRDEAFAMAGVFVAELLTNLRDTHFGAAVVQCLGLEDDTNRISDVAERHNVSRQTYFATREKLAAIMASSSFPRLPKRRAAIETPPGYYSASDIRQKFGVGFDKLRDVLRRHEVPSVVHKLRHCYSSLAIDQLYQAGEFERSGPREKSDWIASASRQRKRRPH